MALGHPKSLPAMMGNNWCYGSSCPHCSSRPDTTPETFLFATIQEDAKSEVRRRESRRRTKSRLGGNSAGPDQPKLRLRLSHINLSITTMATSQAMRQLGCLRSLTKASTATQSQIGCRFISTAYSQRPKRVPLPPNLPEQFLSQIPARHQPGNGTRPSAEYRGLVG